MTAPQPTPDRSEGFDRDDLLADAAVAGLDLDAALVATESIVTTRRKRRLAVASGCVVLALVALVAGVVSADDDSSDVAAVSDLPTTVATAENTSTSTTVASSSTVATTQPAMPDTIPEHDSAPTTSTIASSTTVTTTPPEPLQARFEVLTGRVAAGDTARVRIAWEAGHLRSTAPDLRVEWGDPAVDAAPRWPNPCDQQGRPASGSSVEEFRYATTGRHPVRITVQTCGGDGNGGQTLAFDTHIEVTDARLPDGQARAVVVTVDPTDLRDVDLWRARAEFEPAVAPGADDPTPVAVGPEDPVIAQVVGQTPARVLVVGVDPGQLRVRFGDDPCLGVASLDAAGPTQPTVVALSPEC